MTVSIRLRSGAWLAVVLVVSACAGGAPSVEPPPPGEPPQGSAVSPTSVTAGGGNGSLGTVSSSSTVVFPPVVPPLEVGGDPGGMFVDVSAGFGYSCGLREGGGVECWEWGGASVPSDWWEIVLRNWSEDPVDAEVPGGVFSLVSAGFGYACGLRPSGVLVCWGRNRDVVGSPPGGVFTEVSVGLEHACAVRVDEKVVCWGSTGWREPVDFPPEGVFVDFALANGFGCGVRAGGSVECWGGGYTDYCRGPCGELPLPEGEFQSVHAWDGDNHVCGLRTDRSVECWRNILEDNNYSYLSPPEGEFASVFFVGSVPCGLRPSGEAECWSDDRVWSHPEPGDHPNAVYGEGNACGYYYRARLCWESGAGSPEEVTGIVEGSNYYCGLRPGGEAVCDYFDDYFVRDGREPHRHPQGESPVEPPEGPFAVLASSGNFVCGLRSGGAVECWGMNTYGQSSPPEGRFTQVKVGWDTFACGLRPSGELECWGYGGRRSKIVPPRGPLTGVHAGWGGLQVRRDTSAFSERADWGYSCGLRPDQSVECWGDDAAGHERYGEWGIVLEDTAIRVHHPEGEFTEIGVGKHEACGLRPTGVVECWGAAWMNPEDWSWSPAYDVRSGEGGGYAALSVGGDYSCALLKDSGAVDCWSTDRSETYQLAGPYTAVSAGYGHQCGVLATGDVHCWEGENPQEQRWEEITIPAEEAN